MVLPLMAILFMTVDIAWIIFASACIQEGAREGVRYAVTGSGTAETALDTSVKSVVKQYSFGFAKTSNISIDYYPATGYSSAGTPASIDGTSQATAVGNIVKVTVQGVSMSSFGPLFRTWTPLQLVGHALPMSCNSPSERGSATVEFALCVGLFWLPLFVGATQFGFQIIQGIQVTQVCRDAGHMYAYGIDFSQTSNQYLLASFAPALNVDPSGQGGSSVVILSTVNYIGTADCQAGGYAATCPNYGQLVFTNQTIVGQAALHASAFGAPTTNNNGSVSPGSPTTAGYLNSASALVTGFPNITISTGASGQQYAYIAEMYSKSSILNWFLRTAPWVNSTSFF